MSHTPNKISDCISITEPQSRSKSGPQMARRWLANVYFVRRCSQVCLKWCAAGSTQVYAGHATGANSRKCILYVSQVYRKCTASDLAYTVACHVTMSCTRLHATPHGKKLVPHDSESSYMTLLTNALTLGTLLAQSPGAWKGSISSITFYFTVGSDESA